MTILSQKHADLIADLADEADYKTLTDLMQSNITSEDDYTSALMSSFRHKILNSGLQGIVAQKLPGRLEREFGADAAIVISDTQNSQACLFEAKWPRIEVRQNYVWDRLQQSNNLSHFHTQIIRQQKYRHLYDIWEMIYGWDNGATGSIGFFPGSYSCCIPFGEANAADSQRNPNNTWQTSEIQNVMTVNQYTIGDLLRKYFKSPKYLFPTTDKDDVLAKINPKVTLHISVADCWDKD